ncbi:unnamed protein product [Fraxinus pennsylvanica]|uniref:Uncharacterized protein n=1 Tax=Fraxinus pennsylvanica TaxID=56036 RepID=A0AAD2A6A9_9LAMI|nr:unnamed protein product [Fraxinus pennsylvanica]
MKNEIKLVELEDEVDVAVGKVDELDLRCGAKKSLADPPYQSLALQSYDIGPTRPHLLLVRGSAAFARLYDRRMLPPLSSNQKMLPPPLFVNYFCPMHLTDCVSL